LPEASADAHSILDQLDRCGSPATTAMAGPRFFGFVIGGALPVAPAANWLAAACDQNSALYRVTPATSRLELPPCAPLRRSARRARLRGAERGGAEPGARRVRRCRTHAPRRRCGTGRGYLLVRWHRLAGPQRDAHQRVVLATTDADVELSIEAIARVAAATP
jgi:hypothetical protein